MTEGPVHDSAAGETCDECGTKIPTTAWSLTNPHHDDACSLHPASLCGPAQ